MDTADDPACQPGGLPPGRGFRLTSGCEGPGGKASVRCAQALRTAVICAFTMAPGRIAFLLGQATPHAVHLAGPQGKGQALPADRAPGADLFRPRYLLDGRTGR